MLLKKKVKLIRNIIALTLVGSSFSLVAQALSVEQCLQLPQRQAPCDNLIYSSFNNNGINTPFCLCKSDKNQLLDLLEQEQTGQETKSIRQLVSQHRLTQPELISLLRSVY